MFQDYKLAHSKEGDAYKEEAQSAVTVGWSLECVESCSWGRGSNPTRSIFVFLVEYGIMLLAENWSLDSLIVQLAEDRE
jgi:hypothetical protein